MKNQINHQLLLEMYGNDFPYITEIFSIFLEDIVPDITALREEYTVINKEALRNRLHQLKPTFGMVGLEELQKQLEALERIVHDNVNEALLKRQMELFFKNFTDILPLVKEYHSTLPTHD
jgi:HPt (histidine-containing phosphotransfer) domain-containing protein